MIIDQTTQHAIYHWQFLANFDYEKAEIYIHKPNKPFKDRHKTSKASQNIHLGPTKNRNKQESGR